MPSSWPQIAWATINDQFSCHVTECLGSLVHQKLGVAWVLCAWALTEWKLRCGEEGLSNAHLNNTHKCPSLDRVSSVKPYTAVLWSLWPSATPNNLFSSMPCPALLIAFNHQVHNSHQSLSCQGNVWVGGSLGAMTRGGFLWGYQVIAWQPGPKPPSQQSSQRQPQAWGWAEASLELILLHR